MMVEEAQNINMMLPIHYDCEPLDNGVKCVSNIGMEQEQWEHTNNILKQMFGDRLVKVNDQGDNQTHNLFYVLLKKQ